MHKRMWGRAAAIGAVLVAYQAWAQSTNLTVEVLSSRADLVTGGDALVRISGAMSAPSVTVDGKDASSVFKSDQHGGFIGRLEALKDGANLVVAKSSGKEAAMMLTNHPINATLFAGPQQTPFVCENESHGLAPAKDASCAAPSTVKYFYRNKAGDWKPFDANAPRPVDVAMTRTTEGKEVPLIVRQEKGVINRSAYLINILHDPSAGPLPTPGASSPASGWNGKLIYSFGGGVQANYHMGRNLGAMTGTDNKFYLEDMGAGFFDLFITGGYAIATGSLNVMGTNTDDVKSAETVAKVKEHFIEQFGRPLFTIGHGGSGGSIGQHMVGNAYPGLLDGIMPGRSFPDVMTFLQAHYDCVLLMNVFDKSNNTWTDEQKGAVAGKYWGYCPSNAPRFLAANPDRCDLAVKNAVEKDPALKAKGVRCTYQDNQVNVFGTDPTTGLARNPFDNVGVQYGLAALNQGKITFEQFLEVNTRIGGLDNDGKIVPQRMTGDALALRRAYQTGRVNSGEGLAGTAVVDIRSYVDGALPAPFDPNKDVDVHDSYHSFVMRARFLKHNGNAANHVMLSAATLGRVETDSRTRTSPLARMSEEALAQLDRWLTNVVNDTSDRSRAQKLAANKPAGFVDACYLSATERVTDMARCNSVFPHAGDPRIAAGAPASDDVFKCALKPVDAADYKTAPTAEQLAKLRQVFPDGVCDYKKPGIGESGIAGTWAVFTGDGEFVMRAPSR